ncbi:MAG: 50S ribosomal protein L11 methyltransferase [Oscillospiraceae bacterium]|nr:50S ribosomal protein L11 methyltransferase [Candidatus Equicaccousia limihippi]
MDFNDITVTVPVFDCETAENICNMVVPYGIYTEDYSDLTDLAPKIAHIDLIDEELLAKDKNTAKIHIYIPAEENPAESTAYLKERFSAENIDAVIDTSTVLESSYKDKWKEYFKQRTVGKNLLICPSWETPCDKTKTVIRIDPGAAFGTGTHQTTVACLELLEKYVNNHSQVLDIGTGSGILSVVAVKLGAKLARGIDIDECSVRVAKETAKLNGVDGICSFDTEDAQNITVQKYDIVVANIVADVIIYLSDIFKNLLNKDGVFIVSGIIDFRADEVKAALIKSGATVTDEIKKDNWYAFGGKYDRI